MTDQATTIPDIAYWSPEQVRDYLDRVFPLLDEMGKALERMSYKAKWAWQFVSAVALDGHSREHDSRTVAFAACPESPCPGWREDLLQYQDAIAAADAALSRYHELRGQHVS